MHSYSANEGQAWDITNREVLHSNLTRSISECKFGHILGLSERVGCPPLNTPAELRLRQPLGGGLGVAVWRTGKSGPQVGLNCTELIPQTYIQGVQHLLHVLPIAGEGPPSTAATEEDAFSMRDAFLPAARSALEKNLEKQAMKAYIRGKNCKVPSFEKGCVRASSESCANVLASTCN